MNENKDTRSACLSYLKLEKAEAVLLPESLLRAHLKLGSYRTSIPPSRRHHAYHVVPFNKSVPFDLNFLAIQRTLLHAHKASKAMLLHSDFEGLDCPTPPTSWFRTGTVKEL